MAAIIGLTVPAGWPGHQDDRDVRTLARAKAAGFDLGRPQILTFVFSLAGQTEADTAARALAVEGFETQSRVSMQDDGWLTIARKRMTPSLDTLTTVRQRFARLFEVLGGDYSWYVTIPPESVCTYATVFAGPCETVHARMFATVGSPWVRLWKVGTKRILGVWELAEPNDPGPCPLPPYLATLVIDDKVVYADFMVRPVSRAKPGVMQQVCVASASGIVAQPARVSQP